MNNAPAVSAHFDAALHHRSAPELAIAPARYSPARLVGENRVCNLCEAPSTIDEAHELGRVRSNVRRFLNEVFTVWRCRNCESLHSLEAIDYAEYYRDYPMQAQSFDFVARRFLSQRLKHLVKAGVTKQSSILDYGCGNGVFVRFLRERGYAKAEGYDPYSTTFGDRNVLAEQYDVVTSQDVVEHVPDPRAYVSELRSMVAPGGLLAIGTPDAAALHLNDPDQARLHQPFHRHLLTRDVLARLMTNDGSAIVRESRRFYVDTWLPFLNSSFLFHYIQAAGGALEATFEPIRFELILRRPSLLLHGLFGRLGKPKDALIIVRTPTKRLTAG